MPRHKTPASIDRPLLWLHGEIKTPPWSLDARREVGFLLRQLQLGANLSLPASRPMPSIGPAVHELRVKDEQAEWRVIYRVDDDAIVIAEIFAKKTRVTPKPIIDVCKQRLRRYDLASAGDEVGVGAL